MIVVDLSVSCGLFKLANYDDTLLSPRLSFSLFRPRESPPKT